MDKIKKGIEDVFETVLFNFRFMLLIPVIGSLGASLIMLFKGTMLIVTGGQIFITQFTNPAMADPHQAEKIVALLVNSVDNYLFATVLLIFSMGLYELFISKIDPASRTEESRPNWLNIQNLDDLKGTIGKVILMILIVSFLEKSLSIEYSTPLELLYLCVGIILVAGALFLTHAKSHNSH